MNKAAIKNFAIAAREKLIRDARYQAGLLGITDSGVTEGRMVNGAELHDIGGGQSHSIQGAEIEQRRCLVQEIRRRAADSDYATAYRYVMEEAAYTWFNRLIAIRFMEVNGYLESRVLSSEGGTQPEIVAAPFDAGLDFTDAERQRISRLKAANRAQETDILFRLLFRKQCNALNAILPGLFSRTDSPASYEELLLNISCNDPEGVVRKLVTGIPEADFDIRRGGQVEILGWLYQYYNTEPKAEAFAKKGRVTKDELPAVTQLFTPDWIVRYMTENSVGRLWTDAYPDTLCREKWKYYLDEAPQTPDVQARLDAIRRERAGLRPEDIKILDPCMGSGHILVYAFDVLMDIYHDAGWPRRDAAQSVIQNNLYGLDIDKRAYQLSYFALMMKARQHDRRFLSRGVQPNVAYIQESNDILSFPLDDFGWTFPEADKARTQLENLLSEMKDAREYGSLVRPTPRNWDFLESFMLSGANWGQTDFDALDYERVQEKVRALLKIAALLSRQYDAVITNPPYMGGANMSGKLSAFVKKRYPDSKADLFACFMERCLQFAKPHGYVSMITMHSWMFIGSFEDLRRRVYRSNIINFVHLGIKAFEEIGNDIVQTCAFICSNRHIQEYSSKFIRLVDYKNYAQKQSEFFNERNQVECKAESLTVIPGSPVAYWVSGNFIRNFSRGKYVENYGLFTGSQNITGDNEKYLRCYWEVNSCDIGSTWRFYAKGGDYRQYYGNLSFVVDWSDEARRFYATNKTSNLLSEDFWYKPGITYSAITSRGTGFRYLPEGCIFDKGGPSINIRDNIIEILALFNSNVAKYYFWVFNPSINLQVKDIKNFPIIFGNDMSVIHSAASTNVDFCKADWDAFETSWDFKRHPLLPKRDEKEDSHDE